MSDFYYVLQCTKLLLEPASSESFVASQIYHPKQYLCDQITSLFMHIAMINYQMSNARALSRIHNILEKFCNQSSIESISWFMEQCI